jgi:hypothetical protein
MKRSKEDVLEAGSAVTEAKQVYMNEAYKPN